MSVQKKSLIGDRTTVQKAIIASKPETAPGQPKTLQADVHSMKAPKFKAPKFKAPKFKAPKFKAPKFKAPKII